MIGQVAPLPVGTHIPGKLQDVPKLAHRLALRHAIAARNLKSPLPLRYKILYLPVKALAAVVRLAVCPPVGSRPTA